VTAVSLYAPRGHGIYLKPMGNGRAVRWPYERGARGDNFAR
jgi:hypothetical protein